MRILGGDARGMKLLSPKGMKTRPMNARVKEALFNILGSSIEDAVVLDLFAGSGSLGLEALSRGAKECHFVERGSHALPVLQANLEKIGYQDKGRIIKADAFSISPLLGEKKFDLFILDPPYHYIDKPISRRKFLEFLARLTQKNASRDVMMVLHYRHNSMSGAPLPAGLELESRRVYGSTELMFITQKDHSVKKSNHGKDLTLSKLRELFEEAWEYKLSNNPILATFHGDHRYNDSLPSLSLENLERLDRQAHHFLEKLHEFSRADLSSSEQTNYDIFEQMLKDEIAEYKFQTHLMPVSQMEGFHVYLPELASRTPFREAEDYRRYARRLEAVEQYLEEHITLMRKGMEKGYTVVRGTLHLCVGSIEAQITVAEKTPFFKPFLSFPDHFSSSLQEELKELGKKAIDKVMTNYKNFAQFVKEEYTPAARVETATSALPNGKAYYEHLVRHFTTLSITPEEVHKIGHDEVKRLREEMENIITELDFEGGWDEFMDFLREDPRFYCETPHELMAEISLIMKKMDGELPRLFNKLPRTPYGIKPVPEAIAPRMPKAYYMPSVGDGTTAGFYYINTDDLKSRPLYEMEALSLHEAVPGHHLQIALQQELENIPTFRRFHHVTAYIEGWALYSERLGLEVGFYEDPYHNFGRLIYEIWRACRLVVDTGLHYLGWTREESIEFMSKNSSLSMNDVSIEVDRYINLPGQAISYKMGELKITALRKLAEESLGPKFDIREFHEVLLGEGAIPLEVLETKVKEYIEDKMEDKNNSEEGEKS